MPYCTHQTTIKRPLLIKGHDRPQFVCSDCWERAIDNNEVMEHDPKYRG